MEQKLWDQLPIVRVSIFYLAIALNPTRSFATIKGDIFDNPMLQTLLLFLKTRYVNRRTSKQKPSYKT